MSKKVVRFKLSEDMVADFPYCDFEYTAYINKETTKVTWVDNGKEEETNYFTDEVIQYFKDNFWVEIS